MGRNESGPRRSTRTGHVICYNENMLYPDDFDDHRRKKKKASPIKSHPSHLYNHRYSLRGSRSTHYLNEDYDYSEEESFTPLRQKSAKRRKIEDDDDELEVKESTKRTKKEDLEDEDDEEVHVSSKRGRMTRQRSKMVIDDEDEDNFDEEESPRGRRNYPLRNRASETIENDEGLSPSKRLSTQTNETKTSEKENDAAEYSIGANKRRGRPTRNVEESRPKDDDEEEEEEESAKSQSRESTVEPRTYSFREKRGPPPPQFASRPQRKVAAFTRQRFSNNTGNNRRNLREKRKRRYSSSSTESSDEDLKAAKRDAKDEAKFQRRQMRSMHQSRQNLLPINMTDKDLAGTKHVVKERLRQLGGNSCTDIDPMSVDQSVTFEQVGGLTSHLQSLKETVLFPLVYPELFETFKITPPKGMLFYGPPGTGKTLIARALANECSRGERKVAFFMRKGADCLSKWIGESERQLRLLFDQAYSMRPSIIFFDEIDGLAPVRSSRQDQIHSSIVSTLLALMDGLDARGEVVVIGATNRLDSIDPALRRPGRFDRELRFSLPDKTARRAILDIHTKAWKDENRPNEQEMEWLADKTSGYCGADLRSLCTEAVLVSIRNKFPHIYLTSDKLDINPKAIKINQDHFVTAMRNIVPACRRDVSIVSKQLNPRLGCLMERVINKIFEKKIPMGYLKPQNVDNLYKSDLEKVVRALETPPSVSASRFLIHGKGNQGQTHYYLPVIANRLDHLVMHSISCVTLFSSVNPEESLNQMVHAAIRSTSNDTPTVLLLPDIDVLQSSLPSGCWNMLVSRLESFVGFTSLLMIATLRQDFETCSEDIKHLFGFGNTFEIMPPKKKETEEYFRQIVSKALVEPVKFNPDDYPPLPKVAFNEPMRKLSGAELKVVEEKYANGLRHFRIFLRDLLSKLLRDRRFNIFNLPVDKEDAEDYYEIITNPLCLTEMMAKLNRNEYTTKQDFLDDILLIRDNAIEYNPETDMPSRVIRNNAFALVDITEALFEEELDDGFVDNLEEMRKMIEEAKGGKKAAGPIQLQRRTRQSIMNGFKETDPEETIVSKEKPAKCKKGGNASPREDIPEASKLDDPHNEASNDIPSVKSDSLPEVASNPDAAIEADPKDVSENANADVEMEKVIDNVLIIDKDKIEKVIAAAVDATSKWSIPQLETLGSALTQKIERYTGIYDRTALPLELIQIIKTFVP